jgi:hypothetical protein
MLVTHDELRRTDIETKINRGERDFRERINSCAAKGERRLL